jgi:hypothetical protein
VPLPAVAALSLPGFALRYASSSDVDFTGTVGLTTSTSAISVRREIGSKSLSGSNPVDL